MFRGIAIAIGCLAALIFAAWGVFMLFSSPARLINTGKRGPFGNWLHFPEEGTAMWKLVIVFYRFLGVLGLSMSAFIIVMLILHLVRAP